MEHINVGFLSILPPIIAIVLALKSKDVVSSLIIGILSGTVIYVFNAPVKDGAADASFLHNLVLSLEYIFVIMADKFDVMMIIFMCVLGALVAVVTLAGGARAYGQWASKKVKSPVGAKLATSILGIVIFIDDYFNCLTVGTVMRPVTDQHKISREKLAYLIDAMAAPICIIAPISSWAASILTYLPEDVDRMQMFLNTIPFNFYALLTIVMVLLLSIWNLDFGPMAKFERQAKHKKTIDDLCNYNYLQKELIVYGKIPLLNMNYCLLGEANKCYPKCKQRCENDKTYYLKDRLNMEFEIMPDNIQTVTTIFNSKTTSISPKDFDIDYARIDILHETVEEINNIIDVVKSGNKFSGKDFTSGNLNREV